MKKQRSPRTYGPRTRVKDYVKPQGFSFVRDAYQYRDGVLNYHGTGTVNGTFNQFSKKTCWDYTHANYWDLRKRGLDVSSDCTISTVTYSTPYPSTYYLTYQGSVGGHYYVLPTTFVGVPHCMAVHRASLPSYYIDDIASAKSYVLTDAMAKMYSSEFQGQVFAAEALKTLSMLRKPFSSALKLTQKILRKQTSLISRGMSASKALSSAWLEYRYGFQPLMYDISDLTTSLAAQKRLPFVVLRCSSKTELKCSPKATPFSHSYNYYTVFEGEYSVQSSCMIKAGYRFKLKDSSYGAFLESSLGLSLRDVPNTVWELIPFSFVVDWFANVGSWIKTICPNPNIEILSAYLSTTKEDIYIDDYLRMKMDTAADGLPYGWLSVSSPNRIYSIETLYNRQVNNLPAHGSLRVAPYLLNLNRKVDSVALILQSLTRNLGSLKKL